MNKKYKDLYSKIADEKQKCTKTCKCGHRVMVAYSSKKDYVTCSWCKSRVYYDDAKQKEYDRQVARNEFIFKVNNYMNKKVEEDNFKSKRKPKTFKTKTFNENKDYIKFYNDNEGVITLYDVEFTPEHTIKIYYTKKMGRPRKNLKGYASTGRRNSFKPFNRVEIDEIIFRKHKQR